LGGQPVAGNILDRIRKDSRDPAEKGRWFEQLFMRLALQQPEFEIDQIWRWPLTGQNRSPMDVIQARAACSMNGSLELRHSPMPELIRCRAGLFPLRLCTMRGRLRRGFSSHFEER